MSGREAFEAGIEVEVRIWEVGSRKEGTECWSWSWVDNSS